MVDFNPFSGSFTGVQVTGNTINSQSNFIKVGIAMGESRSLAQIKSNIADLIPSLLGGMVWGVDNTTSDRTFGGSVTGNTFTSGLHGYFGVSQLPLATFAFPHRSDPSIDFFF